MFPAHRMHDFQLPGMQQLPARPDPPGAGPPAVAEITENGVAGLGEVGPYLMGAAGCQIELDQADLLGLVNGFQHPVPGDCLLSAR